MAGTSLAFKIRLTPVRDYGVKKFIDFACDELRRRVFYIE
jgi:hypothetical protein